MNFKITSGALLAVLLCLSFTSQLVRARSLKGKIVSDIDLAVVQ